MSSLIFVENDGGKLAVEVFGPQDGPLVVCSPGLGDFRGAYKPLADSLVSLGYRVALVDLRGHGDSSTDFETYGDEETAGDFLAVVSHLTKPTSSSLVSTPAVLAGASMSAAAAAIAAAKRPDLIAGLVLFGPVLRNAAGAAMKLLLWALVHRPIGPAFWKFYAASLWPGLGSERAAERAAQSAASITRTNATWTAFQKSIMVDHAVVAQYLPKVKSVPTMLVMGDKDPDWTEPLEEAKWLATNFDAPTSLTVEGSGHAPHYESPEVVSPAVEKFLGRIREGNGFKVNV